MEILCHRWHLMERGNVEYVLLECPKLRLAQEEETLLLFETFFLVSSTFSLSAYMQALPQIRLFKPESETGYSATALLKQKHSLPSQLMTPTVC